MKKHAQWLQYLTALSLTLSGTAFAAPTAPILSGDATVSTQAAAKVNEMAERIVTNPGGETNLQEWWRVIWAEWVQIIIVEQPQANAQQDQDFDSYASLLDRVKNES